MSKERKLGTDKNRQLLPNGDVKTWEHFYFELPASFVDKSHKSVESIQGDYRQLKDVYKRALEEVSLDAAESVLELINSNSIYRGAEHKRLVESFVKSKKAYAKVAVKKRDNYCWLEVKNAGAVAGFRNSVIGTLVVDISDGTDLVTAVKKFESKVAPTNYKRPKPIMTKKMIEQAQAKVKELGLENSLGRRHAKTEDITVDNVLFADRDAKKAMGGDIFDEMIQEVKVKPKNYSKVEEIKISDFLKNVLPTATNIELLLENKHAGNLMSLISPTEKEAKTMFKWNNNFCWSYNGDVADSMKEDVKNAGGNVEGVLRASMRWNEDGGSNQNDFDLHCLEPNGNLISYPVAGRRQSSSGMLDVDIIDPGNRVAVENIIWTDKNKMKEGVYKIYVHNYTHRGGVGFEVEIECDGQILQFKYDQEIKNKAKVLIAEIKWTRAGGMEVIKSLDSTASSREIWGVSTNDFHKVKMIMNSPNHWDGNEIGNRHTFFILDGCKNDGTTRGFYNEFLKEELMSEKRVFEALGSKMRVEESDNQLSGVGISSTQKGDVVLKVTGKTTRMLKVIN